jgi:glycosyltransferase involved in cell wall biosynthesis
VNAPATVGLLLDSYGPGGAERMVLQLARELRERGREVVPFGILTPTGEGWLHREFRRHGFEPEILTLRRALDLRFARDLRAALSRRGVAVAHAHEFTFAFYGAVSGWPLVITMHGGTGFAEAFRRRVALGWAARRASAVVGVSEAAGDHLARALGLSRARIAIVPNGVPAPDGNAERGRAALGLADGQRMAIAVGSLYRVKGHAVLLEAVGRLRHAGRWPDEWLLAIAGRRGEEEAGLRARAEEPDLAPVVRILGHRDDVSDLVAAADLFVMPSLSEGMPLALLEAMHAGRAIVASAVGGVPEAARNGSEALLVPPADPEALAQALGRVVTDPALRSRLGAAALARARDHYAAAAMAAAYERLYDRALA